MSFAELKSNYDILQKMSFPDSEQSEQLAEWVFDLMEVDAYYSQLALAVFEAKDYTLCEEADMLKLKTLKIWLESLRKFQGTTGPTSLTAKCTSTLWKNWSTNCRPENNRDAARRRKFIRRPPPLPPFPLLCQWSTG